MTKIAAVKAAYDAFGRNDIPSILALVADDVAWDNSRVASKDAPWNGNFSGKAHVPEFFTAVAENMDFKVFEPRVFAESDTHVFVLLHLESTLRRTGKPLVNDAVHVWRFNAHGLISGYQHFNDTAMELLALRD